MRDLSNIFLRIAGIEYESIVDGPGMRNTIFTQGCNHNCKGCHNPQTHSLDGGYEISLSEIYDKITDNPLITGITLSGGDPILQYKNLIPLVQKLKEHDYNIWMYTGYCIEDLLYRYTDWDLRDFFLPYIDVIVDGPFVEDLKSLHLNYRGSSNQRFVDVQKSLKIKQTVFCEY
nr:MAG TPA: anaerobic ribonucleoside-triphosphate reductase activating protein [Caudoviricetes sp.]